MRVHIGIITAGQSLKNLLLIEDEMRKLCDITFLPYSSPVELINLYLENEKNLTVFCSAVFIRTDILQIQSVRSQNPAVIWI